jgi:hypothetical protein
MYAATGERLSDHESAAAGWEMLVSVPCLSNPASFVASLKRWSRKCCTNEYALQGSKCRASN